MSSAATVTPKTSWLAKVGQTIGKILGIVAKDVKPEVDIAANVAEAIVPQFSSEIQYADNLVGKIVTFAVASEGVQAAAGTATGSGAQKLATVVTAIQPTLNAWVAANFPGAKEVSAASSAGLVNAVVAILNEVGGGTVSATATATP